MQRKIDPLAAWLSVPTVKATLGAHRGHGPGFDTIRLIAASAVVLHHALGIQIDIVHDDPLFAFSNGYTHLGQLAVTIFFTLSGFLVTPGLLYTGDVLGYLSRRFMRIMPLLFTVVAATVFLVGPLLTTLPFGDYFSRGETWLYFKNLTTFLSLRLPGVTGHTGLHTVNDPLWTLHFEWLCYFLLAAAAWAGLLRKRWLFASAWAGSILLMLALYGPLSADEPGGRIHTLLLLFGYFGAGVTVFLFADRLRFSAALLLAALAALAACYAAGMAHLFAPFLTAYIVVGIGLIRMPWSGWLSRIDLSYGVYLTHALVLAIIMHFVPMTSGLALFAVALPVTMAVAWGTWTMIEKPALAHKALPAALVRHAMAGGRRVAVTQTR